MSQWKHRWADRQWRPFLPEDLEKLIRRDEGGCWLWLGAVHKATGGRGIYKGYQYASRVVYARYKRILADNEYLRRLCAIPRCVNPDHYRIVRQRLTS